MKEKLKKAIILLLLLVWVGALIWRISRGGRLPYINLRPVLDLLDILFR